MNVKIKLFLSTKENEGIFGGGKWHMLRAIKEQGSIKAAADSLGRSYRKAWGDIKKAEEGFGKPLVIKSRGGANGGHAELTDFGEILLKQWDKFHNGLKDESNKLFNMYLKNMLEE